MRRSVTPLTQTPNSWHIEGIKACQFAISGIKKSSISHLNPAQIKALINNILPELGLPAGKICSQINTHLNSTIIEMEDHATTKWLTKETNQKKLCKKIDPIIKFHAQVYKTIVFNVPIDMDPNNPNHILEICKANNLDTDTSPIMNTSWAKSAKNCKINQRTTHLYLTFNNTESANRVVRGHPLQFTPTIKSDISASASASASAPYIPPHHKQAL